MKNIIVTGGLGFIGSNLVEYLVNKKYFVIIIDNLSYSSNIDNLKKIPKNKYKIYYQDIQNRNKNLYILKKYHPVAIFNLAAELMLIDRLKIHTNLSNQIYWVYLEFLNH